MKVSTKVKLEVYVVVALHSPFIMIRNKDVKKKFFLLIFSIYMFVYVIINLIHKGHEGIIVIRSKKMHTFIFNIVIMYNIN